MNKKLVSIEGDAELSLMVPDSIPEAIISGNIIPLVLPTAQMLAKTTSGVIKVVAKEVQKTKLELKFYDEFGKQLEAVIEEIAPVLAAQRGLDFINDQQLDPELEKIAITRIKRRLASTDVK